MPQLPQWLAWAVIAALGVTWALIALFATY
jgi:hypothetical protein